MNAPVPRRRALWLGAKTIGATFLSGPALFRVTVAEASDRNHVRSSSASLGVAGNVADSLSFLREMTRDVIEAARVQPGERKGSNVANSVGFPLLTPGGNYPAYWIRDFSMSLGSGFITADEMLAHLRLAARCQNGPTARRLRNGLLIPPYAIPDHINFDGSPVFYPGTYSAG